MWIIIFFVLPLAGLAYALWHIWCLLPFGAPWRGAIVAMCTLAFLTLFLNFSRLIDRLPLGLASACYETGNSSIFILLYTVMAFLLLDIGRLAHVVPRSWLHANGYTAAALLALMAVTFTYGYFNYRHKVRQTLELATAKDIGRDMKVVMMSDLHMGYHNRRKELARWVDMVNAERPDLILIAGDIVDGSLRPLEEEGMADELRRLNGPVLACPGNHEYIGGMAGAERFMAEAGVTLLRDSVATVGGLCVIGRDDRSNPRRKCGPAHGHGRLQQVYHRSRPPAIPPGAHREGRGRLPAQRPHAPRPAVAHIVDNRRRLRMLLRTMAKGRQVPHRHSLGICCGNNKEGTPDKQRGLKRTGS